MAPLLLILLLQVVVAAMAEDDADFRVDVDYEAFLARADMLWEWDGTDARPVPYGWWSMGFTGNGLLGAMVTTGNETAGDTGTLRIELGRTDVLDDRMPGSPHAVGNGGRCDRVRLPIGYFQLSTAGSVKHGTMRLSLYHAEIRGVLTTSAGQVNFTIMTHAIRDLNIAHLRTTPGENQASWEWHPRPGNSVWASQCAQIAKDKVYTPNPTQLNGSKVHGSDSIPYTVQPLLSGAAFATAYSERLEADGSRTFVSSTAQPMAGARGGGNSFDSAMTAVSNVQLGMALGWSALRHSHQKWWARFYKASFLSFTDSRTEAFYWAQMYKLASATHETDVAPTYGVYDHTGPWFTPSDTCCPLFNWDMNFPVQYQIIFSSNHPEIGYGMAKLLSDPIVRLDLAANAGWINTSSTSDNPDYVYSAPVALSSFDMIADGGYAGSDGEVPGYVKPPDYQCNLLWALVNYWNLYRATLDADLLPDLYTLLRGAVNHQLHEATKGADGTLHMPVMKSPEYPLPALGGDTSYQLALTKWGLRTIMMICKLIKCEDPKQKEFAEAFKHLAEEPVSSAAIGKGRGLMISNGTAFTTSHRHYSHMIGCWNTGIFSWDDPEDRQLCLDTLDNWHSGQNAGACQMVGWSGKSKPGCVPDQDMTWEWDGFSYPFSSSANTRAGRPTAAMGNLTLMLRTVWPKQQLNWQCKHTGKHWPGSGDGGCIGASMQPNTFQGENGGVGHADPTSETPLALATSVQDLFLYSDDDSNTIRVFQGLDETVAEAAFHQLRGAGAVLVSGSRKAGKTMFLRIEACSNRKEERHRNDTSVTLVLPRDWHDKTLAASPSSVQISVGTSPMGSVTFNLAPSESVLLYVSGAKPADFTIRPAAGEERYYNWWGQHEGGAGRD